MRSLSFFGGLRRCVSLGAVLAMVMVAVTQGASPAHGQGKLGSTSVTSEGVEGGCTFSFPDVQTTDYFYEPVHYLYCLGSISGYADGTIRPNANATRGQLSKIIVVAKGWDLVSPGQPSFSDVQPDNQFYAYIETAHAHGVIAGYSDGTFWPNASITRGQITKIIVFAQGWPVVTPTFQRFSDVAPGSTFYGVVETAVQHGAVSGYPDGTFRPSSLATRGQISKIVYYAVNSPQPTPQEQQTVDIINARRAAMGLGALRSDPAMTVASRGHSYDIGPLGLCQHNGTNGSSPWDRIAQAGYGGFASGEVVGCGYDTPQSIVDGWWASPSHYAILTDPANNDIGCGWWINPSGYGWQTCDLGIRDR